MAYDFSTIIPPGGTVQNATLRAALDTYQQLLGLGGTASPSITAASTTQIATGSAANRLLVNITGDATISSFGSADAGTWRIVLVWGSVVLANNADLSTPTGGNVSVSPGSVIITERRASDWRVWSVIRSVASGGYLMSGITRYTGAGSGTYTTPAGTTALLIRAVGGGGGGGGGGSVGAGGGGGAGGFCERFITSPASSYAYTVGAGGAGGAASGGDGGNGGNTTIASMTASGGTRGLGGNVTNNAGGTGGSASGGDLNVRGGDGHKGGMGSGAIPGGGGGASAYGGNGGGAIASGWSGSAGAFGGGGGGGSSASGGVAGGNGGAGYIEIISYVS